MRFIDLFAGLGGFHVAMERLGHECVFSCELDATLRDTYEKNFGIRPEGDIRGVDIEKIPAHDILCAGFPCQPFSKAGLQLGLDCPRNGDLFSYVVAILEHHKPRYFLLENVPNLLAHGSGGTYELMKSQLQRLGYKVVETRISPHSLGIPQVRERAYIVGSSEGLADFEWPEKKPHAEMSIRAALDNNPADARQLSNATLKCLNAWQRFIKAFPKKQELPSFPIWTMEFGATYPYEDETPFGIGKKRLGWYRGSHGIKLSTLEREERWEGLPSYACTREKKFPDWKIDFIRKNRELYKEHKGWIDKWLPSILSMPASHQKLEWNCKGGERDIWQFMLQFRASGVRVKRPTTSPSLIAMNTTQVPIVGWQKRYLTPRECARLQSLGDIQLPEQPNRAFKALGNAVNADVIYAIAEALLPEAVEVPEETVCRKTSHSRLEALT